jgi:hypothetical protein
VKKSEVHFARIELNGAHTRGQTVLDHPRITGEKDNIVAVMKIDFYEYENMLLWGLYGKHEVNFSVNNHILFVA